MSKTLLAVCLTLALVAIALPALAASNPAETVPFDHWAYDAVQKLVDQGIIIGYPDGTFRGNRAMTRYEFAMAISRLLDCVGTGSGMFRKNGLKRGTRITSMPSMPRVPRVVSTTG